LQHFRARVGLSYRSARCAEKTTKKTVKVQYEFDTKKEAEAYLRGRGWRESVKSLGEQFFVHDDKPGQTRKATKQKNKKWANL
jgi:hypothetical protein